MAAGERRLDLVHAVHVDGRAFGRHARCRALRIDDLRSSATKADGRSRLTFSRFPQLQAIKPRCPCLTYGIHHDIFPFPVPLTAYNGSGKNSLNPGAMTMPFSTRSEEHTSELQSLMRTS